MTRLSRSTVGERRGGGLSVSRSCAFTVVDPVVTGGFLANSVELRIKRVRAGAYAVAASEVLAHTMLYAIRRPTPSVPWWPWSRKRRAVSVDGVPGRAGGATSIQPGSPSVCPPFLEPACR